MQTKHLIGLGLAAALASGLAIAKHRNGDMGIYLDDEGNVVGSFVVSCDGVFSYEGTRTSNFVVNGQLFCHRP